MKFYGKAVRNSRAVVRDETLEGDVKRAVVRMLATNKELDFYNTRMMDTSLDNYVQNARDGVTFCDSHNWQNTGYGRTISAERIGDDVFVDAAVLYDEKWNGMTYAKGEDLIFAVRHRDFDVSIGFGNDDTNCSVCKKLIFTEDCEHYLGESLTIKGKAVQVEGQIENAELLELSLVYDGATPGAGTNEVTDEFRQRVVKKTDTLMRAGKATRQQLVDMCKRLRIPEIKIETQTDPPPKRSRRMPKSIEALETKVEDLEEENEELTEELTDLREERTRTRAQLKTLKAENKGLKDAETQIETIEDEIRTLCVSEKKGLLEEKDETPSESDLTEYKEKVNDMRYNGLRAELKDLAKQRAILDAVKGNTADPNPDDVDNIPGEKKPVSVPQQFYRRGVM